MNKLDRDDVKRWGNLVHEASQVRDYSWPTDADQFNAAWYLLSKICEDFPEDDDSDIRGSAVHCLADAILAAMRLVPPEALDGAVIRPHRADQAAGDERRPLGG